MSTKVTLSYSHGGEEGIQPYHLFLDIPELDTVFLRLDGAHCDSCKHHHGHGMISVPLETWKHIVAGWIADGAQRAEGWQEVDPFGQEEE